MTKTLRVLGILFLGIVLFQMTGVLQAQEGGVLKGKVIDANEKLAVPTVRVTVAGTKKFALTGAEGTFVIPNIAPGTYKIVFELAGFIPETRRDVVIGAGQTVELDVTLSIGFAHEISVTARREAVSLQWVPQNIEIVTEKKLAETPQVNIVQALNNIPGVDVESGSGNTTLGTFMYIDGYEDVYIRKMVDGVDVGEVVNNWSMLNSYPQDMISQVEVVKGGSSSVWGSNMGGIINVITKRPRDLARPQITLKSTYSRFNAMDFENGNAFGIKGDNLGYSANILGNVDKFGYMLGYSGTRNDGFVRGGQEKNYNIFTKFSYDFSDDTFVDFLYNRNKMDTQTLSFLYLPDLLGPDFPYYWNYQANYRATTDVASMRFSTNVTPALNLETQLKFHRSNFNGSTEYLDGSLYQPPAGVVDTSKFIDQKMGFTLKGSYRPSEALSVISGLDYYRIKADFSSYIASQPVIYVNSVAPFVNMEYRIGNLGLHLGARYDHDSSFGNQLSPSVGATFNFLKASLFRVNAARTFKVPDLWYTLGVSYFDMILPNPDLKPERAWAYSAGFETQELRFLYLKLSGYYHRMTDGIVRVPADIEGRFTWGNISKFLKKGYEAEVGVLTPFGVTGYIGTNYNKHENTTAQEAVLLTWIPTRTHKAGLMFKDEKSDFFANLRARWIWWNMDPDTASLFDPHDKKWIVDFRISKGFKLPGNTRLGLFIDIFNLTNQLYWDRSDSPNPRRWAQIGVEVNFK